MRFRETVEGFARSAQLRRARSTLTSGLADHEAGLLGRVSTRVHPRDTMFVAGRAEHYLGVGLSASRVVQEILRSHQTPIESVLDFACGYGRVLRFLKAMFPDVRLTGAEIDPDALHFCRRVFAVETVRSSPHFETLSMPDSRFDLIWCGSLATHLDEGPVSSLLKTFYRCLEEQGVCVFTTHGRLAADRIRAHEVTYGLTAADQRTVVQQYDQGRYAYADYEGSPGYGISLVGRPRMSTLIGETGAWRELLHLESGWDNHQDVYALVKQ